MIHDVNAGDHLRTTPLMLASKGNHLEMVDALMKHPEIQLNKRDYLNNRTALHHAVYSNNPIIVTQLLSNKETDTFAKDKKHDNTPLQAAIVQSASECADILREHGAPEEWRSYRDLKMIHPRNPKLWLASTGTRVPKVSKGRTLEEIVKFEHERCLSFIKWRKSPELLEELYYRKLNDLKVKEAFLNAKKRYYGHPGIDNALYDVYVCWEKEKKEEGLTPKK
jgi:ankyrin repeat protein